ncbi:hypothetical protein Voc01_053800 [Virgisporangium ochraceum]|uniref:PAS domain S-box-containing protein n=1 Tax=Virgisporangium ochraceum TaxID=65505 RepID=A0A8J3ZYA9_9ACTN|nr:hypothetical protein Voc01_053800 [Virgisporangium ochraceum]
MWRVTDFGEDAAEVMPERTSRVAQTRRVVSAAIAVFAISIAMSLAGYVWDWIDSIVNRDGFEADEWLSLIGVAWLPVVAGMVVRLVRLNRALADTAHDALGAYRDTVRTAYGWLWHLDASNRITYSSAGVRAVLGYEPHEVLGHDAIEMLVMEEDRPATLARVQAGALGDGWQHWRTRVRHRDGSVRHVVTSATPIRDDSGRFLGFRGSTVDVTGEFRAAEAEQVWLAGRSAARERIGTVLADPGALNMALQPIVDVRTRRVVGHEALARFTPVPYRPPNVWFEEAWQVGLGPELELHAVALACRHLTRLPTDMYLSVNLSPQTIVDPRLSELLTAVGPAARRVVVEVTEHAVVEDYDALADVVRRLAHSGVRLAVDDAGAGYASMQHILRLRPDIIKLDRSIVADAHRDPARRALLGAMSSFAGSLGVVTVAEGVETAEELAVLGSAGITSAQGFHIARPDLEPVLEWTGAADDRPVDTPRPTELVGP